MPKKPPAKLSNRTAPARGALMPGNRRQKAPERAAATEVAGHQQDSHHDHDHDHHGHPHDHDDGHAPRPDHDAKPLGAYEALAEALTGLLVNKGVLSEVEIAQQIDTMQSRSPALGARVIARAWTDPAYKARLMTDARAALMELKIDFGQLAELKVVESTPEIHNIVVCTLCSCYPKMLLGIPPAWYKNIDYRSRTVRDPRGVLAEFGLKLGAAVKVRVHDSTADMRYLVLPVRPEGTGGWSETELASLVTRDTMIGVAEPRVPPEKVRPSN